MIPQNRREFLADVGRGMLIASVGAGVAGDLGLGSVSAAEPPQTLTFGKMEPLVCLLQETAPAKLLPILVDRLRKGTNLRELVAAAALANARTFGGEDYVGFHTMMALVPAYHMAQALPQARQPLPVLKVLYRNTTRIQQKGGRKDEVLHPVQPTLLPKDQIGGEALRDAARRQQLAEAEKIFAGLARGSADDAFNHLLYMIEDGTEVHRVVMAYRAWALLDLVGREQAHTMLRQSVHYCVRNENDHYQKYFGGVRALLPKLLERYRLLARTPGKRKADAHWIERMSQTIFASTPEQAADAAAQALAEGIEPDGLGEAICLAANQLILRDEGRPKSQTSAGKPVGSVHGDSIGVHACDSANAWRNIARVSNPRNCFASLILAAYQVPLDRTARGGDFLHWEPYPRQAVLEKIKTVKPEALLRQAEEAIKAKDQAMACALVHRYGQHGYEPRPVIDLLLRYGTSEDGALHAEKYYRTATEEFGRMHAAYRWRQLVALARVTASEYGQPAPGYDEACRLLKV